jgi:ABC-type transport system involved in multi-copper enzyme maturation permease subunit
MAVFLPVLIALVYRILGQDMRSNQPFSRLINVAPDQALTQIMVFFLQFLSVLVALFYGTALIADEVDNRTIISLFIRPIRKHWIIIGKLAAYILAVLLILIPPIIITFLIIAVGSSIPGGFTDSVNIFIKRLGVIVLSLMVYGAIFTFLGTWQKRPVLVGLVFAFGWEKMVMVVPGVIRKFSIIHHLMSLFPNAPEIKNFVNLPGNMNLTSLSSSSVPTSTAVLLIVTCVFLGLTIYTIYRKEYKFE